MVKDSLKDQLIKIKNEQEIFCANLYNDQTVNTDTNRIFELRDTTLSSNVRRISSTLLDAGRCFSYLFDYDSLNMKMLIGLIFKKEDLIDNNKIRKDAVPEENIVRYYTGLVRSYLNGSQNKIGNDDGYSHGCHGFVNYNDLIKALEDEGLIFNGPKTFEDLKKRILAGEEFDISVSVSLIENKKETNRTEEPRPIMKLK